MTKRQEMIYTGYKMSNIQDINGAYKNCSAAKKAAYNACRKLQYEMNGYDGRITGAGTYHFSYAFRFRNESGKECLCYCTHMNNYMFVIEQQKDDGAA